MIRTFLRRLLGRAPKAMLAVGDEAPAFEALDHEGRPVRSADLAGQRYLLWFYPKADTPG